MLAAICADDVVLAAASVAAAEVMVAEMITKLKGVGLTVWCRESTMDEPPENDGRMHWGGVGRLCWVKRCWSFAGSKVGLDGNVRHAIADGSAQAGKRWAKWRTVFSSSWLPEEAALEHFEIDNVAGFSLESERVDDGASPKRQNFKLECECGGERDRSEEATVDGNGSVVESLAQGLVTTG